MPRPSVDVVVPFAGTPAALREVAATMRAIELAAGDTLTIVDNGATPAADPGQDVVVIHAPGRPTSYHARNAGAARGRAPWIHFLDADVVAPPDLLDRLFAEPVADRVAVLAGGVADEPADGGSLAARYCAARTPMSQAHTADRPSWAYAQTANAAFRRAAFEEAGGFAERARSGGDADLCFRLRDAGWELLHRPAATVVHRNRTSLRALVRQRSRHGAGAAWLERRHPGSMPARSPLGLTRARLRDAAGQARHGEHEAAAMSLVDVALEWAFVLGRRLPNEPAPR